MEKDFFLKFVSQNCVFWRTTPHLETLWCFRQKWCEALHSVSFFFFISLSFDLLPPSPENHQKSELWQILTHPNTLNFWKIGGLQISLMKKLHIDGAFDLDNLRLMSDVLVSGVWWWCLVCGACGAPGYDWCEALYPSLSLEKIESTWRNHAHLTTRNRYNFWEISHIKTRSLTIVTAWCNLAKDDFNTKILQIFREVSNGKACGVMTDSCASDHSQINTVVDKMQEINTRI